MDSVSTVYLLSISAQGATNSPVHWPIAVCAMDIAARAGALAFRPTGRRSAEMSVPNRATLERRGHPPSLPAGRGTPIPEPLRQSRFAQWAFAVKVPRGYRFVGTLRERIGP